MSEDLPKTTTAVNNSAIGPNGRPRFMQVSPGSTARTPVEEITTTPEKEKKDEEVQLGQEKEEKVGWFEINKGFVCVWNEWVALDHITAVFLARRYTLHEDPIHYTAVSDRFPAVVCIVTSNKWTYRCRHDLRTPEQAKDALLELMDHVAAAKKGRDLSGVMGIPPYDSSKSV